MTAPRSSLQNGFAFCFTGSKPLFTASALWGALVFPAMLHADETQTMLAEDSRGQEGTTDIIEEAQPRQYLSTQLHYLVPDREREIARNGIGMGLQYGRQWKPRVWWETELAGYNLESGVSGSTDFYQAGLTTGLLYAFSDRKGFTPFAVGAIGVMYSDVIPDDDDGAHFHANAGLGVVSGPLFQNGLKLRAEARYLYNDNSQSDSSPSASVGNYGDWRFSVGVEVPLGYTRVRVIERVVYQTREVERIVEKPFLDSDHDGISDERDQCPNTLAGARVDANGCMIVNQTITFNNINFELNAARISPGSRQPLDTLVQALRSQTDIHIEIAGHSDNTGSAAYNQTLSDQRARAVRQYLIQQGIDGARLSAKGYGESEPVADNRTASGRAMNRRVEFRVMEQGE
ncbi:hypothetical protein Q670_09390 [Alcanivorax sp. P2S70]|nr:OmpA family protein [Alcanivorax sp. P2S70]ERP92380.1 hypothetical protein Q670_09390 [Alcanivorax sp. P2S70]